MPLKYYKRINHIQWVEMIGTESISFYTDDIVILSNIKLDKFKQCLNPWKLSKKIEKIGQKCEQRKILIYGSLQEKWRSAWLTSR